MPKYLIQIVPSEGPRLATAFQQGGVPVLNGRPIFDYLAVNLPEALVPQVRGIAGVLKVVPDKPMGIFQPLPVNLELASVRPRLAFPPLLFQGLAATLPRSEKVWPTGESRKTIGADVAEAEGVTGRGVKVCVTDTGIDTTHPQVLGLRGESTLAGAPLFLDENGHGTHVATTIAGSTFRHPFGTLKGVAPGATLIIIKVLGYLIGAGSNSSVLAGMERAAQLGADVLSMSLGGEDTSDPEDPQFRVVRQLTQRGMILSIAAGNSGPQANTIGSPGSAPDALTVGAINRVGQLADFSSRGPTKLGLSKPDCVAPGVDILSGTAGLIGVYRFVDGFGRFAAISGTSMACPNVSGVVALALEYARKRGKTLTTSQIKEALRHHHNRAPDNQVGYGLITYPILKKYIDQS